MTNDAAQHAFIWGNGSMRDLGTLGGEHSGASAINIRGWVVGGSAMPGRTSFVHAFFWDGTQMADLGTLGGVLFGATLVVFALSPWFWVCVVALVGVGAGQQVYMASNNALIQTNVEEEFRGRIVSTLFLNRSMVPLGTVLAGFGTQLVGVQATTAAMAAGLLLLALTIARLAPAARNLD